ncbi:MAG: hypothetical protein U1F43_28320 [Myxococcota bacterium]
MAAPPEAYEPEPAPADAQVPAAPGSGLGHAIGVWFKRGTRSDLEVVEVLPDEQVVSDLYADSESFRRILLWRRAALFVAMIFQIPPLLLELGNGISDLASKDTPGGLAAVSFILVILNAILLVTVFVAFKRWESWRSSRRLLIMTWLVAYSAPFVVAIIPFTSLVGADNMNREAREIAGLLGGLSYFVILAPKVLALVPGVMRAALIAKVAFPMSPMPGWLVLLSAPFDALLMHVVLMMPYQMAGGGFMAPALFLVVAAPLVIFVAGRKLVRPSSFEEAVAVIKRSRGTALILNVIGGIFLLIGLVDTLGIKLPNGHVLFGPADAIMPVFSMIAGIFVLEVIGLDVMLGAWIKMHGDEQNPEFTAGLAAHRQHMDAFVAVVHRDEPPPPSEPPATSALADDPFATTQPGGPPKA